MCLIGLRLERGPEPTLLVAANRDEFHGRPTKPSHWWHDPVLFGGRDLEAGGTWLGLTAEGRFAAVTNIREMRESGMPASRGDLPVRFLASQDAAGAWCRALVKEGGRYAGFNLLAFDGSELWWCSNREAAARRVGPGVHALSNHLLDTPWPKVRWLREALAGVPDAVSLDSLAALLTTTETPPGPLPDTGVGEDFERMLAPAFIVGERYGTRCSTALRVSRRGFDWLEVSYGPSGAILKTVRESSRDRRPGLNSRGCARRR